MMARLGDICYKITDGSHNPPSGVPYSEFLMLSSKNIYDDCITYDDPRYLCREDFESENKRTQIEAGDILLTIVGTVGRVAVVPEKAKSICLQRSVAVIKPRTDIVLPRFLMYQIQNMKDILEKEAKGVAQKGIYLKQVESLSVGIFEYDIQKKIVYQLDGISKLISLRKQQLSKLDELVKSRFVELFGDCNKQTSIKESGLTISDGNYSSKYPRSEEFVESGIPFIRANNLKNGMVIDEDMYYITPEKHKILLKGHLKPNDVLITTRGNIGQVAIVPEKHNDSNINAQIVLLRDENSRFIPQYLLWALQTEEVKVQYLELQTGTALKQLPVGRLEQVKIKEPSIELQNQFATFVEQTDKSKLEIQNSLETLETLKKALMQKYFG